MKRCLCGNIDPRNGSLDNAAVSKAIMNQRNTPCQDTGVSPAEMLYGYRIRDHLPNKSREVRKEWSEIKNARELRNAMNLDKMAETSTRRSLPPLKVGDTVRIQNQTGVRARKWSNSGKVVKVFPHRQYGVVIDGSRRVTMRNRKFLRRVENKTRQDMSVGPQPPAVVISNIPAVTRSRRTPSQTMSPPQSVPRSPGAEQDPVAVVSDPVHVARNVLHAETPTAAINDVSTPAPSPRPVQQETTPVTTTEHTHETRVLSPINNPIPPGTSRRKRAINELRDHNSRGLKESQIVADQQEARGVRRSVRTRRRPERLDDQH